MTLSRSAVPVSMAHLSRAFGSVRALDDFSLDLAPGEMVCLLGPSGCGKTTALRALSGLEDIDAGSITVDGVEVSGVPANKRDMAMVFQSYSLFPHMTVADNISFALELRKVPRAERTRILEESLELVGLGAHGNRYAHQLSGGQQQRVALARALAVRPQVLLLDEPLSALDAKVRVQLRDEIRRIQSEIGITALFVTHDQEEALAIADRVGVMQEGRLEQIGTPEEIYTAPRSGFVADFIGVTNRLAGRAASGVADVLGQRVPLLDGSADGDVAVLVRPENIELEPDAAGSAEVVVVGFLGAHSRVQLRLQDGTLVSAQVPVSEAHALTVGGRVALRLRPVPALAV
ncbi:MAG TPA: ABC transporter ATP-binding protein [Propionibacterium sp.]|nr:ABC transporter ATP-binding protein [Propionibacterium sp.]